ncbi:MAG: hypothetical protein H7Z41_03540 [Cytophagales bacterium]|nr:hypothetical protein [Armatimonadota bacterium]
MSILRRNFGVKFWSLIIAILLYWIASGQRNPVVKTEVYVQPQVSGLGEDLVAKTLPQGSPVSVSGSAEAVEAYRALEPKATVDLTGSKPGANRYPVKYLSPDGFSNALEIIGPSVTLVTLERKKRGEYSVDVIYDDAPPAGYAYSQPRASPARVQVEGLAADVGRVARVVANLDTSGTPGAINQEIELVAQDVKQQAVESVTVVPSKVRATLGLKKTPATKTVLLSADLNGTPAPGYYIAGYRFWPNTLTISGSQDLLASRSSLSVPVDVDGIRASAARTVRVQPPSGLTVVGTSATVHLRLDVQPIAGVRSPVAVASPPAISAPVSSVTPPLGAPTQAPPTP